MSIYHFVSLCFSYNDFSLYKWFIFFCIFHTIFTFSSLLFFLSFSFLVLRAKECLTEINTIIYCMFIKKGVPSQENHYSKIWFSWVRKLTHNPGDITVLARGRGYSTPAFSFQFIFSLCQFSVLHKTTKSNQSFVIHLFWGVFLRWFLSFPFS